MKWIYVIAILSAVVMLFGCEFLKNKQILYNPNKQILYNRCFGGQSKDIGVSIAQALDGTIVIVGYTHSNDGDLKLKSTKDADLWILKIDPSKPKKDQVIYNRCFGGSAYDSGQALALSDDGTIVVTGYTYSTDGDLKNRNFENNVEATADIWLLKIDPSKPYDEQIVYNRCFGGADFDFGRAIASAKDGTILVLGNTMPEDIADSSKDGDSDLVILKIDPSKSEDEQILYHRRLGGTGFDIGRAIIEAENETILVVGYTNSNDGTLQNIRKGNKKNDLWVLKIDPSKSEKDQVIYNRCFGGSGDDIGNSAVLVDDGTILITGVTTSNDGDLIGKRKGAEEGDLWIVKIDPSKPESEQIVYNHCLGGSNVDFGRSIALAKDRTIFVMANTNSTDGDITSNHGDFDLWILKLDLSKPEEDSVVYKHCFGGTRADIGRSMIEANDGNIFITGDTFSSDGDVSGNHGNSDLWVLKIDPSDRAYRLYGF